VGDGGILSIARAKHEYINMFEDDIYWGGELKGYEQRGYGKLTLRGVVQAGVCR